MPEYNILIMNDIMNLEPRERLEEEAIRSYKETVDLHAALDKHISDTTGATDPDKIQKLKENLINEVKEGKGDE
jgi:hypothetical protein